MEDENNITTVIWDRGREKPDGKAVMEGGLNSVERQREETEKERVLQPDYLPVYAECWEPSNQRWRPLTKGSDRPRASRTLHLCLLILSSNPSFLSSPVSSTLTLLIPLCTQLCLPLFPPLPHLLKGVTQSKGKALSFLLSLLWLSDETTKRKVSNKWKSKAVLHSCVHCIHLFYLQISRKKSITIIF